jgi:hypothetical protein
VSISKLFFFRLDPPIYAGRHARHYPGQHFSCFLSLLRRPTAITANPSFPSLLSFLDSLLPVSVTVICSSTVIVTELSPRVIGDELLVALSALGHGFGIPFYFQTTDLTILPQKTVNVKLKVN